MQNRECKYYEFAGVKVAFTAPEYEQWNDLEKFRIEPCEADVAFDLTFEENIKLGNAKLLHSERGYEIYEQNHQRVRIFRHDETNEIVVMDIEKSSKKHEVFFLKKYPKAWGAAMMLKIMNLPRLQILHQGIFLHTSFVVWNGEAILFSGKKQVGKSTQAGLWREHRGATIANGDRAILKKWNGRWYACGSPYSGTSKICENMVCPIKSIITLSQGPENIVADAGIKEAFVSLMKNCSFETWDREQMERTLQLTEQISTEVRFVKLSCLPDKNAVETLEEYLWQSQK